MEGSGRREFLLSKGWIQAVVLVVLFGFFVLGLLAYRTYMAQPAGARSASSTRRASVVFTGDDISQGPAGLPAQRPDGVRLGVRPRRLPRARLHRRLPAPLGATSSRATTAAPRSDRAARRTIADFKTNRYDERTGTLTLTAPQAAALRRARRRTTRGYFSDPTTEHGLRPERDHRPGRSSAS